MPKKKQTKINATLAERGSRYGTLMEQGFAAQHLKKSIRQLRRGKHMCGDQWEALDQIMTKISRIIVGDADYVDNWHDIAGYATLVENRLTKK